MTGPADASLADADRILLAAIGPRLRTALPARAADHVPDRRPRAPVRRGRNGCGPGRRRPGGPNDGDPLDRDRQGLQHAGRGRWLPGAGAPARQGVPLGGARRRPSSRRWIDAAARTLGRRPLARSRRLGIRRGDPGVARRGGPHERRRPRTLDAGSRRTRRPVLARGRVRAARCPPKKPASPTGPRTSRRVRSSSGPPSRSRRAIGAAIRALMDEARAWRKATQPLAEPNCGSVFKNPPGDHAARLVEGSGAKGLSVGGATVSRKHANFIVAAPGTRAVDVVHLIAEVRGAGPRALGHRPGDGGGACRRLRPGRRLSPPSRCSGGPVGIEARRRRARSIAISIAGVLLVALAALAVSRSAIFSMQRLSVTGGRLFSDQRIERLAGLSERTNVVWLSTSAIERRLLGSPWIASATVSRSLPSTVTIVGTGALAGGDRRLGVRSADADLDGRHGPRTGARRCEAPRGTAVERSHPPVGVDGTARRAGAPGRRRVPTGVRRPDRDHRTWAGKASSSRRGMGFGSSMATRAIRSRRGARSGPCWSGSSSTTSSPRTSTSAPRRHRRSFPPVGRPPAAAANRASWTACGSPRSPARVGDLHLRERRAVSAGPARRTGARPAPHAMK